MTGLLLLVLAQGAAAETPLLASSTGPSLTLVEARRRALEGNPELKVLQARLDQAHELSHKAWSGYLPQLTAGASWQRNNVGSTLAFPYGAQYPVRDIGTGGTPRLVAEPPTVDVVLQQRDALGTTVKGTQAIIAPSLWASIDAAYLTERAIELNTENARREILLAVAQQYLGAVGLKEAIVVREAQLRTEEQREKDTQVQFDAGTVNKITLLRAQIDRVQAEQDLRRARYAYASAKSALAALLDRTPDFEVLAPPDPAIPSNLGLLEDQAPGRRLDVLGARKSVEAARAGENVYVLSYLPSIGFNGAYTYANTTGFTGRNDSWYFGFGATWTLFDGGLREANLRDASARKREAEAAARGAEVRAKDEVRRALNDLESAQANRTKAEEQLRLARENGSLVRTNFEAGVATYLEQSDAITAVLNASLQLINERLNAQLAVLRLERAAGLDDSNP
jgi:outer membrane protein TolC